MNPLKLLLLVSIHTATTIAFAANSGEAVKVDISDDDILEVVRHLYRWHMDETMFWQGELPESGSVFIREIDEARDEGDSSRYVELIFDQLPARVVLKKADYEIPELNLQVRNDRFKITQIFNTTESIDDTRVALFEQRTRNVREVVRSLYETRNSRIVLHEDLRKRLALALGKQIKAEMPQLEQEFSDDTVHTFFLAPLSPVSNDLWVFWENARRLIKFSSDADYDTEAFWVLGPLGVEIFDLNRDVIVAPIEAHGRDGMITKDMVGRILYNCIVLGERVSETKASASD